MIDEEENIGEENPMSKIVEQIVSSALTELMCPDSAGIFIAASKIPFTTEETEFIKSYDFTVDILGGKQLGYFLMKGLEYKPGDTYYIIRKNKEAVKKNES